MICSGFSSEADFIPVFEERCADNNHRDVFGVVEPEHVFGFPVEIDLEQEGESDVAGNTQTFLMKEKMTVMGVMYPPHHQSLMGPIGSRLRGQGTSLRRSWGLVQRSG